jgi:hypothetical protein
MMGNSTLAYDKEQAKVAAGANRRGALMADGLRPAIALTGLATIMVIACGGSASKAAEFDGIWTIYMPVTNLDECGGKPFRSFVAIVSDGTIGPHMQQTSSTLVLEGRVSRGGQVVANGWRGDDRGSATGQLGAETGEGNWKLSTRNCFGYWKAKKVRR